MVQLVPMASVKCWFWDHCDSWPTCGSVVYEMVVRKQSAAPHLSRLYPFQSSLNQCVSRDLCSSTLITTMQLAEKKSSVIWCRLIIMWLFTNKWNQIDASYYHQFIFG